jgi:hypothetical protein
MGAGRFDLEIRAIDDDASHRWLPSLGSTQDDSLSPLRLCERRLLQRMIAGRSNAENAELKAILPCPDSHRQKLHVGVAHGKLQKVSTLAHC